MQDSLTKFLIVSDDQANAFMLETQLAASGFTEFTCTSDGIEAMKSLAERPVDLIIVDTNVRFLHGWALVKELKISEKIPNMAVILVGSEAPPASKAEMQQFGVVDYLKLPTTASKLHFMITSTLSMFRTSGTIESKYTKAKVALIGDGAKAAIAIYSEIRSLTAKDTRSSVGLAQSYVKDSDFTAAEAVVATIDAAEGGASTLLIRMKLLSKQGRADEAKLVADAILALDPSSPFYYSRCLRIADEIDDLVVAEHVCVEAIKKDFALPEFSLMHGKILFARRDFSAALATSTQALDRFGPSVDALNLRGACLRKLAQPEAALACYEHALKISPMDAKVYFNLAICANSLGQGRMAQSYLSTCLKIAPGFKRAEELLAELVKNPKAAS